MKTIKQGILYLFITTIFASCGVDMFNRVEGNRNVVTKTRKVNGDFTRVKASSGLDVFITQGDQLSIVVEADQNLHEFIKTEINDGRMRIYSNKNIWRSKARKVYVTIKEVEELEATSGSDLVSEGLIKANDIVVSSSSGADLKLKLEAKSIQSSSSSGSDLKLSGEAIDFTGDSSSGSSTSAYNLKCQHAKVKASSGGDISIHASESLEARASSGGDVRYRGNPKKFTKKSTSGGSINSRS